jgi:hypothetical protein
MHNDYALFVDDIRVPKDVTWINLPKEKWVIARDFSQFIAYIKSNGLPKIISLDHDLGGPVSLDWSGTSREPTGADCVRWLIDYCIEHQKAFPSYHLHTQNPIGKTDMECIITNFLLHRKEIETAA